LGGKWEGFKKFPIQFRTSELDGSVLAKEHVVINVYAKIDVEQSEVHIN